MGNTYVVRALMKYDEGYTYMECYSGESLIRAIRAMRRAKRVSGCVRLEWR
jgi:hypothetical protein